jgi:hypothetical protein
MPNVEVNCSVANCVFHEEGNICGADQIKIDVDHKSKYDNTEFAQEFDFYSSSENATESADTCCKTFKPFRDKGRKARVEEGILEPDRRDGEMPRGRGTRRGERQDLSWSDPDPEPLKPRGRKVGKAGNG